MPILVYDELHLLSNCSVVEQAANDAISAVGLPESVDLNVSYHFWRGRFANKRAGWGHLSSGFGSFLSNVNKNSVSVTFYRLLINLKKKNFNGSCR